ncbi:hypothetical protein HRbin08_00946 [bacterium HR08]|nr:hypothetical protein HRbin08_00946 [bacterium HR08]
MKRGLGIIGGLTMLLWSCSPRVEYDVMEGRSTTFLPNDGQTAITCVDGIVGGESYGRLF